MLQEGTEDTEIMDKIKSTVKNWRSVATRYKITKEEQEQMSGAFWE